MSSEKDVRLHSDQLPREWPKVSCIVATHNRPELVQEAVASLKREPYPNLEIIVVDDGSDGDVWQTVQGAFSRTPQVVLVHNDIPLGPSGARNRGISLSTGTYVTFMDDDDLHIPGRIEAQVRLALDHQADFVTCTRFTYETQGRERVKGKILDKVEVNRMWLTNQIVSVTPLVERELMSRVGFDPSLRGPDDMDAWIRCLLECKKTVNYNGMCLRYRRTGGFTITGDRKKKFASRMIVYRKYKIMMPIRYRFLYIAMTILKYIFPDPKFVYYSLTDRIIPKVKR